MAREPERERVLASFSTSLEGRQRSQKHNATLGLEKLANVRLAPGQVFSFNRTVGTWSRDAGYRKAPISYNGTLISSWGGGVCQTSTTLYNAALLAGLQVLERHRHHFCPGYVPPGRDAAVAFNTIDLSFRNPYPFPIHLRGRREADRLVMEVTAQKAPEELPHLSQQVRGERAPLTYSSGPRSDTGRLRNSGKAGYEVATFRVWSNRRELISVDSYPAMHRMVQYY
jgi:vancomycin resistance protein YoaR